MEWKKKGKQELEPLNKTESSSEHHDGLSQNGTNEVKTGSRSKNEIVACLKKGKRPPTCERGKIKLTKTRRRATRKEKKRTLSLKRRWWRNGLKRCVQYMGRRKRWLLEREINWPWESRRKEEKKNSYTEKGGVTINRKARKK